MLYIHRFSIFDRYVPSNENNNIELTELHHSLQDVKKTTTEIQQSLDQQNKTSTSAMDKLNKKLSEMQQSINKGNKTLLEFSAGMYLYIGE